MEAELIRIGDPRIGHEEVRMKKDSGEEERPDKRETVGGSSSSGLKRDEEGKEIPERPDKRARLQEDNKEEEAQGHKKVRKAKDEDTEVQAQTQGEKRNDPDEDQEQENRHKKARHISCVTFGEVMDAAEDKIDQAIRH